MVSWMSSTYEIAKESVSADGDKERKIPPMEPPVVVSKIDEIPQRRYCSPTSVVKTLPATKGVDGESFFGTSVCRDIYNLQTDENRRLFSTDAVAPVPETDKSLLPESLSCPAVLEKRMKSNERISYEALGRSVRTGLPSSLPSPFTEKYLSHRPESTNRMGQDEATIWKRGRKQKYAHLTAEERKAIRAAQNREATRRSRERSRARYETMVKELNRLRRENAELLRTREIVVGLLKQHNIEVPQSLIAMKPHSKVDITLKEVEALSALTQGHNDYEDSTDLEPLEGQSRSIFLQPHM